MASFFPNAQPIPWLYNTLWKSQTIGQFGYTVKIYKQVLCPCGSTPDTPSNINCQACFGSGFLYPVPPIEAMMLIADMTQSLNLEEYGMMQPGDLAAVTQPGGPHLNEFDIIIVPWQVGEPTYSDLLERGEGTTDTAEYIVERVHGAWTVDPATGAITKYYVNRDFTVQGKMITWVGNQPASEDLYTINYDAKFEWIVYDSPSPVVAFGQDLGQTAYLRKRHIVLKNSPSLLEG